ncbi:thioredoxin family protein [Caviibacter abscessus]|uniref:thioredoxin family protein n=1 Tax=Caviibacter abscessus TaxID=1766719 RepID=UPI000830BE10|nr:thioredoxin family protein [Caviibacter abscessus]
MAFLDENIKEQLSQYFKYIDSKVQLVAKLDDSSKADELKLFLEEIVKLSENLELVLNNSISYRVNSFEIYKDSKPTRMVFSGIPSGHEFNSFILAILSLFGLGTKLNSEQKEKVDNIKSKKYVEVFVTLSCSFCPEVVQGLNLIALNNENVISNMIDGACYIEEARNKGITVSPTIYVNGEFVDSGAQSLDKLIEIINK